MMRAPRSLAYPKYRLRVCTAVEIFEHPEMRLRGVGFHEPGMPG